MFEIDNLINENTVTIIEVAVTPPIPSQNFMKSCKYA